MGKIWQKMKKLCIPNPKTDKRYLQKKFCQEAISKNVSGKKVEHCIKKEVSLMPLNTKGKKTNEIHEKKRIKKRRRRFYARCRKNIKIKC